MGRILQHATASGGFGIGYDPRIERSCSCQEPVDDLGHFALVAPVPMPEPMQGALLAWWEAEAQHAFHGPERGIMHQRNVGITR